MTRKHFRLYIDESGDHSYGKNELRKLKIITRNNTIELPINHYPDLEEDDKRYLAIIGCIIETVKYQTTFRPKLEELKQRHFPHNPNRPVILHRKDIINKHGPFWRLKEHEKEKEKAFNKDLLSFFEEQDYIIIMVVIDKKAHVMRYGMAAFHPYHYCLALMLERYCGFLHFISAQGDVLAESRGGKEDKQLKEEYRNIYVICYMLMVHGLDPPIFSSMYCFLRKSN